MVFSSVIFMFWFLPCVLFGYYVLFRGNRSRQNVFLLFASLLFYGWGEPKFVFVMMGSIVMNWAFALWLDAVRGRKGLTRSLITAMVTCNLSLLFVFKYLMFTMKNLNLLLGTSFVVPNIALPIGISFFTFQAMSYVLDVHKGTGMAQKNPLNVGLYIALFPQLIAGPIVRYETVAYEINNRTEKLDEVCDGACRFIIGLAKKVIIANNMALVADAAFGFEGSVLGAWIGAFAYSFQIFYDFSGYSDMAIGLGRMFGFHFLENFDYPYISGSITEFWRRWHISLGSFFRDYVYIPLGGSRVSSKLRLVFNLFVVWLLTGIWHGANWTFVVWGMMYFVLLAAEKLLGFTKKIRWFGHFYTLFFVLLGWVVFRADSLSSAWLYIKGMFGVSGLPLLMDIDWRTMSDNAVFFIAAAVFSLPLSARLRTRFNKGVAINALYILSMFALFMISASYIVKGAYNPFIYFNF